MPNFSFIKYDRDEPYAMQMVWNVWIVEKDVELGISICDRIYDRWITGKVKLAIPQTEWTRIVVNQL